ncbi:MAG: 16S rRNA (adenine(1518)-N(6)/adenine(1519)-N(6))-dimethyltransferase RsmA [Elusimicrobiota bacterium]
MAKLGQHFLTDQGALQDIVRAAGVRPGDSVLEIGPGRGALTKPLLDAGAKVFAVEADDGFAAALPGSLKAPDRLTVVNEDFLRFDLSSLGAGPWLVVGNLPYAVGTAILQKVLLWDKWTTATLMFQKEVALRAVSGTGGPDYGLLALSVKLRADAEVALELPPSAFRPRPKVDSAVVLFRRLETPRLPRENEKRFWTLAKTAFSQRRKMAASVLSKALGRPRAEVEAAFAAVGVAADARPEHVPFEAWAALAASL